MQRVFATAMAFLVPLLLAAPAVAILKRHTADLRAAEQMLRSEVGRLDVANAEIHGLDRSHANYLARRAVLEAIDESRPPVLRLLTALGTLPVGVQLRSVVTQGNAVTLAGASAAPSALSAAIAALQTAGLEELVVTPPQPHARVASAQPFELRARFGGMSRDGEAPVEPAPLPAVELPAEQTR